MNNDIKEILEELIKWYDIAQEDFKPLLDCITNLQHDRDDLDDYNRHLHNELTNLQEENKKLKEVHLELNICLAELDNRITKAIECIKNYWYSKNTRDIERMVSFGDWRIDLLNILQGSEDK